MNPRNQHRRLYQKIPTFHCKPGCNDCCGPVPLSEWEAERLRLPGEVLTPVKPATMTCLFASAEGCQVYDKRPLMCRLFGSVDTPRLSCPHGCKPKRLLPDQAGESLRNDYIRLVML